MRILLIGLFLSFWAGVAGQALPFEIKVEDLNLGGDEDESEFYTHGDDIYFLSSDQCLYHTTTGGEVTQLNCDDAVYRSYVPAEDGVYRLSYDVSEDEYYMGYLSGKNYTEIFRSPLLIRYVFASPSGRVTFSMDGSGLNFYSAPAPS